MSLGIAFKAPDGIVLAADSRVTIDVQTANPAGQIMVTNSTYDNATKLLQANSQKHVGAITYGIGALLTPEIRTAHSFMPEFEKSISGKTRMSVLEFSEELSNFFLTQWNSGSNVAVPGMNMFFLVGGYDDGATFGRIYEFAIPGSPVPIERHTGGTFGAIWGGQMGFVDRLVNGHDSALAYVIQSHLKITDADRDSLMQEIAKNFGAQIPWAFLPLQDCIDLVIFLIRTTITMQHWLVGPRGVGGAIDVAVITQNDGIRALQKKELTGELPVK